MAASERPETPKGGGGSGRGGEVVKKKGVAAAERGLWADQIASMRRAGLGREEIIGVVREVAVEPVGF